MAPPIPRAAHVPHTSKVPEACPHCGSHALTRRGIRKKKLEIVQLWRCSSCKRVFTPGPGALHNKTYPLRMILSALTDYNLGYSLQETAARLKKKTNRERFAFYDSNSRPLAPELRGYRANPCKTTTFHPERFRFVLVRFRGFRVPIWVPALMFSRARKLGSVSRAYE